MDRILGQLTLEGMGWPELRQQVWWERIPKYLDGATSDFHKRKRLQAWQLGQDQICEAKTAYYAKQITAPECNQTLLEIEQLYDQAVKKYNINEEYYYV